LHQTLHHERAIDPTKHLKREKQKPPTLLAREPLRTLQIVHQEVVSSPLVVSLKKMLYPRKKSFNGLGSPSLVKF